MPAPRKATPWPDRPDSENAGQHPRDLAAAQAERGELLALLDRMIEARPEIRVSAEALASALGPLVGTEEAPSRIEFQLERFSRQLRALWLRSVAAETAWVLRSPTEPEVSWLSAEHDAFGYERDLQPVELEERCRRFFDAVPAPWQAEHIVFSSGQAALLAILLAFKSPRPLRVRHLGGYFETRQLIQSCPSLCNLVECDADVVIAEPIASNGSFACHGPAEIAAAAVGTKALVLDTTLLGRSDGIEHVLARLAHDLPVLRCTSGLKLLQAGLELANVGIVSVHCRSTGALSNLADALRETRTLAGSGLRYADVLALDAPFVFDAGYADRYSGAVFAHNAALAAAVEERNRLFVPPFAADPSPYCVFALREPSDGACERLADEIAAAARERQILFSRGGSFGFRGHRYEVVRPEDRPPFLRVAMGRRPGWSCRGVIALLAEIAARTAI